MIFEIVMGIVLGFFIIYFILKVMGTYRERKILKENADAERIIWELEEYQRQIEDELYWKQREADKAEKILQAKALLESEEVTLIVKGLRAKARSNVGENGPVYDEKWLIIRLYERLICAFWGRNYVDYGIENVSELIVEHQAELIQSGLIEGYASNTPAGYYIKDIEGLTDKALKALNQSPSTKQDKDWWVQYIDDTARNCVPDDAADLWRNVSTGIVNLNA